MLFEVGEPSPKSQRYSFAPVDSLEKVTRVGARKLLSDAKLKAAFGGSTSESSDSQPMATKTAATSRRSGLVAIMIGVFHKIRKGQGLWQDSLGYLSRFIVIDIVESYASRRSCGCGGAFRSILCYGLRCY